MILFIVFAVFALATVFMALSITWTSNLVRAAFSLFACLFGVSALFVLAGAEFAALAQIIIYVGGILILMLFGVMLTGRNWLGVPISQTINRLPAFLICATLLAGLLYAYPPAHFEPTIYQAENMDSNYSNIESIGIHVFSEQVIAFELIGIILLIALLAAAFLARSSKD